MADDIVVAGYAPDVIIGDDGQPIIRCQLVDHSSGKAQLSKRYIQISLNPADTSRLLAILAKVREAGMIPEPSPAQQIRVPQKRDRH